MPSGVAEAPEIAAEVAVSRGADAAGGTPWVDEELARHGVAVLSSNLKSRGRAVDSGKEAREENPRDSRTGGLWAFCKEAAFGCKQRA